MAIPNVSQPSVAVDDKGYLVSMDVPRRLALAGAAQEIRHRFLRLVAVDNAR